jgi:hypothetical protein
MDVAVSVCAVLRALKLSMSTKTTPIDRWPGWLAKPSPHPRNNGDARKEKHCKGTNDRESDSDYLAAFD